MVRKNYHLASKLLSSLRQSLMVRMFCGGDLVALNPQSSKIVAFNTESDYRVTLPFAVTRCGGRGEGDVKGCNAH